MKNDVLMRKEGEIHYQILENFNIQFGQGRTRKRDQQKRKKTWKMSFHRDQGNRTKKFPEEESGK